MIAKRFIAKGYSDIAQYADSLPNHANTVPSFRLIALMQFDII